jgi:vanillate O-demethylase monooxygenase subunit
VQLLRATEGKDTIVKRNTSNEIPRMLFNDDPLLRKAWHSIGRVGEINEQPTRHTLLGQDWVIFRSDSEIVAFEDRCPHRLAPLSLGTVCDQTISCAYHGWQFDFAGSCTKIPALGPDAKIPPTAKLVRPFGVVEHLGMIFLAPEEPLTPLPDVAVHNDPSFLIGEVPIIEARASAGFMADNFLDMAHFPFLHAKTFGTDEAEEVAPYEVVRNGATFEAFYEHLFANREDPLVDEGLHPLIQRRRLTYRYTAPFSLTLQIDFLDAGGTNVIGFFIQPVDRETCRLYSALWRDDLNGDLGRMQEAVDFEVAVIEEDLWLQRAYRSLGFPIDLTVEVHTRADRITIALRRALASFLGGEQESNQDLFIDEQKEQS